MAFVLDQNPWYRWPVGFDVPVDGRWKRESFDGHFARLGQERVNYLVESAQKRLAQLQAGSVEDDLIDVTDIAIASEVLVGWTGILDSSGNEVPYSETTKQQLLNMETVAVAVITAWSESLQGAKKQTSRKPPSFG